jgi:hypothetical protein
MILGVVVVVLMVGLMGLGGNIYSRFHKYAESRF